MIIRKLPGKRKWRIYSNKKTVYKNGKLVRRRLGDYNSFEEANERARVIGYLKHLGGRRG